MEAWQRHLSCAQSAAIGQTPLHQQNVEAGAGKIAAKDQPMVAGADDDAVIGFFERLRQRLNAPSGRPRPVPAQLDCRWPNRPVNGRSRMPGEPEILTVSNLPRSARSQKYSSRTDRG